MSRFILIALLVAYGSANAKPAADVQPVIERIAKAYGAKQLDALSSVRVVSDRRLAWPGQSQTAAFVEYAIDRTVTHLDLEARHGSVERRVIQNGNIYHDKFIINADGGSALDYFTNTYDHNPESDYFRSMGSAYRLSDLLLAHLLVTSPPETSHAGTRQYQGRDHDLLRFRLSPESPEVTLYVSSEDGVIRRLSMDREIGVVNILFSNYRTQQGLRYASENHIYVDDTLVEYEYGLNLRVNAAVAAAFVVDASFSPTPDGVDDSQMTVDRVSPGRYLVGQDDYTLFVRDGESYIAVNTSAGLAQRYEALVDHTEERLPVSAAIATHHHSDHLDGITEAATLGATLLVTAQTHRAISQSDLLSSLTESTQILDPEHSIGPLTIFVRPTAHAAENAFVYDQDSRVLFQDDHYHGLLKDEPTRAQPTAVQLFHIIESLGIDVSALLSGHARKQERWETFESAVRKAQRDGNCPSQRPICDASYFLEP